MAWLSLGSAPSGSLHHTALYPCPPRLRHPGQSSLQCPALPPHRPGSLSPVPSILPLLLLFLSNFFFFHFVFLHQAIMVSLLYEFPLAAVTNYYILSGLRRPRSIILHTFGGQQSRMGFPGPREASGDHTASSSSKGESICLSFPGPGTPESSAYAPSSSYTPPTSVSILMSPFLTLLPLSFIF